MTSAEQFAAGMDGPAAGSGAVEDYVRAIHHTARGRRQIASTTEVAGFLAVTPASVSSMFKKLARLELVVYVPYRGVSLTAAGRELALRVTRRHQVLETFLVEVLGMPLDRARVTADRLEHQVSFELEDLLAAHLRATAETEDPPSEQDDDCLAPLPATSTLTQDDFTVRDVP